MENKPSIMQGMPPVSAQARPLPGLSGLLLRSFASVLIVAAAIGMARHSHAAETTSSVVAAVSTPSPTLMETDHAANAVKAEPLPMPDDTPRLDAAHASTQPASEPVVSPTPIAVTHVPDDSSARLEKIDRQFAIIQMLVAGGVVSSVTCLVIVLVSTRRKKKRLSIDDNQLAGLNKGEAPSASMSKIFDDRQAYSTPKIITPSMPQREKHTETPQPTQAPSKDPKVESINLPSEARASTITDPRLQSAKRIVDTLHQAEADADTALRFIGTVDQHSPIHEHVHTLREWRQAVADGKRLILDDLEVSMTIELPAIDTAGSLEDAMARLLKHAVFYASILHLQGKNDSAIFHWSTHLPTAITRAHWHTQAMRIMSELSSKTLFDMPVKPLRLASASVSPATVL
jgi:hypothetical protein